MFLLSIIHYITIKKLKENRMILSISSSNDEKLIKDIIDYENTNNFFKNNNITFLLRSSLYTYNNGFLIIEKKYYSNDVLMKLYQKSAAVVVLVNKNDFINRLSGTYFDSLLNQCMMMSY